MICDNAIARRMALRCGVKLLSCIFLLASMGFLCASFVAGLGYGQWTVAAVTGLWSLCTGLYAADAAAGAED